MPAFQQDRTRTADSLKAGSRESSYSHSRARSSLLVIQAALSVVLLIGAGLFVRSLREVQKWRAKIAAEQGGFAPVMDAATARQRANQRHQKQKTADIGGDRIAGQADHPHRAQPPVHHRLARPHRDHPERYGDALGLQRSLDKVVVADRGAAGRDQDIGAGLAGTADAGYGGFHGIGGNAEI